MTDELLEAAREEFGFARALHLQTEKIYIPAMNFTALNAFAGEFSKKLIAYANK